MKKINKKWIIAILVAIISVLMVITIIGLTAKERDSTGENSNSSSSSIITGDIDSKDNSSSSFVTGDIGKDSSSSKPDGADEEIPSLEEAIKNQNKLNTDLPDGAMVGGDDTVSDNVITGGGTAVITKSDVLSLVDDKMISSDILPLPKEKKDIKVVQVFNLPYAGVDEKKLENLDMGLSVKDHTYYTFDIVKSKGTKTAPSQEFIEIKLYR